MDDILQKRDPEKFKTVEERKALSIIIIDLNGRIMFVLGTFIANITAIAITARNNAIVLLVISSIIFLIVFFIIIFKIMPIELGKMEQDKMKTWIGEYKESTVMIFASILQDLFLLIISAISYP
jgi:hypothetical protein